MVVSLTFFFAAILENMIQYDSLLQVETSNYSLWISPAGRVQFHVPVSHHVLLEEIRVTTKRMYKICDKWEKLLTGADLFPLTL